MLSSGSYTWRPSVNASWYPNRLLSFPVCCGGGCRGSVRGIQMCPVLSRGSRTVPRGPSTYGGPRRGRPRRVRSGGCGRRNRLPTQTVGAVGVVRPRQSVGPVTLVNLSRVSWSKVQRASSGRYDGAGGLRCPGEVKGMPRSGPTVVVGRPGHHAGRWSSRRPGRRLDRQAGRVTAHRSARVD